MSQFSLTISLGNDAMRTPDDVARALADLSRRIGGYQTWSDARSEGIVKDWNGNTVGSWSAS